MTDLRRAGTDDEGSSSPIMTTALGPRIIKYIKVTLLSRLRANLELLYINHTWHDSMQWVLGYRNRNALFSQFTTSNRAILRSIANNIQNSKGVHIVLLCLFSPPRLPSHCHCCRNSDCLGDRLGDCRSCIVLYWYNRKCWSRYGGRRG